MIGGARPSRESAWTYAGAMRGSLSPASAVIVGGMSLDVGDVIFSSLRGGARS
jgi:hypothetical protein